MDIAILKGSQKGRMKKLWMDLSPYRSAISKSVIRGKISPMRDKIPHAHVAQRQIKGLSTNKIRSKSIQKSRMQSLWKSPLQFFEINHNKIRNSRYLRGVLGNESNFTLENGVITPSSEEEVSRDQFKNVLEQDLLMYHRTYLHQDFQERKQSTPDPIIISPQLQESALLGKIDTKLAPAIGQKVLSKRNKLKLKRVRLKKIKKSSLIPQRLKAYSPPQPRH